MHWKGGHFEAPVTIDETLFITEHKHYAIRGIVDKTTFGDNSVNTEIVGKNINEISQGYYKVKASGAATIDAGTTVEIKSGTTQTFNAGTSFEINAKNGTGKLTSTGQIDIISSAGKVKIDGNSAFEATTKGTASITSDGNASVISNNGTLDLTAKGKVNLTSSTGSVDINSVAALLNLKAKTGITVSTSAYGTSLPGSGTEGQIYFKLIS